MLSTRWWLAAILSAAGVSPSVVTGQGHLGIDAGISTLSTFPPEFRGKCGKGRAIGPFIRASWRPNSVGLVEFVTSGYYDVLTDREEGCGVVVPPQPGTQIRAMDFQFPRASYQVAPELRVAATPLIGSGVRGRLALAAAWYLPSSSPSWSVGFGLSPDFGFARITIDVDRARIGIPYEEVVITYREMPNQQVSEPVGDRRLWKGIWGFRIGVTVWQRRE